MEGIYLGGDYSRVDPVVREGKHGRGMFFWNRQGGLPEDLLRFGVSATRPLSTGFAAASPFAVKAVSDHVMLTFAVLGKKCRYFRDAGSPRRRFQVGMAVHYS